MSRSSPPNQPIKGRGAASRREGRFEVRTVEAVDDGWARTPDDTDAEPDKPATEVSFEQARSIITRNNSPDVGFGQSINPIRGCEHGCAYCFARPTHSYLGLSPGLDFETKLIAKQNAAERLREELRRPGYRVQPIALGINTDAYQPVEKRLGITRALLEILHETRHPVSIVTKGSLVLRDIDLLADMARQNLAQVFVSVTTLDNQLSSKLEPRATAPHTRLKMIHALSEAGVPVGTLVAPVIPAINVAEIERILEAVREAGAAAAGYVLLRLPHELKELWREWLTLHYPDRADHVTSLIRQMRGGKDYVSEFGTRMRGTGPFAELIAQRFRRAHQRLGFDELPPVDTSLFRPPAAIGDQADLFGA